MHSVKSSRLAMPCVIGVLLLLALFVFPAPALAGSCTSQAGARTDPTTGWSWNTLWYCGNAGGAQMYAAPNKSTPAVVMNSTTSWFVCYVNGDLHNGGNTVWYYSLGDRPAGIWGYMPAENVWTDVDPWPGIPRCPGSPSTVAIGKVRGDPVVIANANGRLEIFAIGWDNAVWHAWQSAIGGSAWSPWESLGGWADQLAVARNGDGRVEIFVRGSDRAVHSRSQITPDNSVYYPWGHQGGTVLKIAAAQNLDGRLEVFAIGSNNVPMHAWQLSQGGAWSAWASFGGWGDQLGAARNLDGRLEMFVRGSDKALHHRSQTSAGGSTWYDWGHRGGSVNQTSVLRNDYGQLDAFTIGTDRAVWRNTQVSPGNGTWSGWNSIGGSVDRLAVISNTNNRLSVFGRNADGALVHSLQGAAASGWGAWTNLGGVIYQPVVERNRDGRLEVVARGTDSRIYHKWQTTAGGAWSGWVALSTLVPAPTRCWNDPPDWFGHRDGPGGARSDPINVIVCFQNGRTWEVLFTALNRIKGRQLIQLPSGPFPVFTYVGFEQVFDPPGSFPYLNGDCISSVWADVQSGLVDQTFSAREGGCSLGALLWQEINHFRVWPQASSGARFLSVSTEKPCVEDVVEVTHCVISFDEGRAQLVAHLNTAATSVGWALPTQDVLGALPAGSIGQPSGPAAPYDGRVMILTFR